MRRDSVREMERRRDRYKYTYFLFHIISEYTFSVDIYWEENYTRWLLSFDIETHA